MSGLEADKRQRLAMNGWKGAAIVGDSSDELCLD